MSQNDKQVAGTHYKEVFQHWDLAWAINMDSFVYQVTKYVSRWRKKNGLQDVLKAEHFLNKYIELRSNWATHGYVDRLQMPDFLKDVGAFRIAELPRGRVSNASRGKIVQAYLDLPGNRSMGESERKLVELMCGHYLTQDDLTVATQYMNEIVREAKMLDLTSPRIEHRSVFKMRLQAVFEKLLEWSKK